MPVVDCIDLVDDDVIDLSSDEDSVEEDGTVEEENYSAAQAKNAAEAAASLLSIPEHVATATTSMSKAALEQDATPSLSMVEHGATTSSLMPGEAMQPKKREEILVASDVTEEAMQCGNHELIAVGDCVGEAIQNIVVASDFELCQEVSQDIVVVLPSAKDKEKQVNASAAECNKQLSIVHTKGVQPMVMHDEHSGFSVMGNAEKGEVVTCKYQGCSKPSQGNTMHCEAHIGGSEGCMVQGCTEGAHEDTPICISHLSRLRKVCCAVTGCTNIACTSSGGRTDRCVKHGGGKRCKYDGCGKGAQGKTYFCVAHGGGRRCKFEGCEKIAQGKTGFCIAHGGGRRCKFEGCRKSTQRKNDYCTKHGGERHYKMCKFENGCGKCAQGRTDFCIAHGGGRRCKFEGCGKSAPWRSDYCIEHGGGRCEFQGCSASATRRTYFCSMHRKINLLSGNNSAHEMQSASGPNRQAEKAEPCKRRNSCSVIGGRAQKRQNTNCYVDSTRSSSVDEMGEERGRIAVSQNNMLKAQQTTCKTNSDRDGSTAERSPPLLVLPL